MILRLAPRAPARALLDRLLDRLLELRIDDALVVGIGEPFALGTS